MISSIKKIVAKLSAQLEQVYEPLEAKNIAKLLLEDRHGVDPADFFEDGEVTVDEGMLQNDLNRLLEHEPIQYVTETAFFYGRKFVINKGALIPRPETEELVHLIVNENEVENPRILDVGSGSGCMTISLEKELKGETMGIDISEQAIEIARRNARGLNSTVSFELCDILVASPSVTDLDILVSNPPYIPSQEKKLMRKNVLEFEPEEALFVPNSNPLLFYRRISELGLELLRSDGKLYFEIHENFGDELKSLIEDLGYRGVTIHKDMQRKDRMLSATNSTSR